MQVFDNFTPKTLRNYHFASIVPPSFEFVLIIPHDYNFTTQFYAITNLTHKFYKIIILPLDSTKLPF